MLHQGRSLSGALTQVSYILSGFSFLRVDLGETDSHFSLAEKHTPQKVPTAEVVSGSCLGHR